MLWSDWRKNPPLEVSDRLRCSRSGLSRAMGRDTRSSALRFQEPTLTRLIIGTAATMLFYGSVFSTRVRSRVKAVKAAPTDSAYLAF